MEQRLTWEQIAQKYPDQWVGLTDIDWEDGANIRSAIVSYIGMSSADLLRMQIKDRNIHATYTTPDNLAPMGTVGYFGRGSLHYRLKRIHRGRL